MERGSYACAARSPATKTEELLIGFDRLATIARVGSREYGQGSQSLLHTQYSALRAQRTLQAEQKNAYSCSSILTVPGRRDGSWSLDVEC